MRGRDEPVLPRKLTVRAHGRKLVLVKRPGESERHVLLKALVFGLYAGQYPNLKVEVSIGHRYKPDLVALDPDGQPVFWAECGEVGREKISDLVRRFPDTHLVIAKQATALAPYAEMVREAMPARGRPAAVELLNFPVDAAGHIDAEGNIAPACGECEVVRFPDTEAIPADGRTGRSESRRWSGAFGQP